MLKESDNINNIDQRIKGTVALNATSVTKKGTTKGTVALNATSVTKKGVDDARFYEEYNELCISSLNEKGIDIYKCINNTHNFLHDQKITNANKYSFFIYKPCENININSNHYSDNTFYLMVEKQMLYIVDQQYTIKNKYIIDYTDEIINIKIRGSILVVFLLDKKKQFNIRLYQINSSDYSLSIIHKYINLNITYYMFGYNNINIVNLVDFNDDYLFIFQTKKDYHKPQTAGYIAIFKLMNKICNI